MCPWPATKESCDSTWQRSSIWALTYFFCRTSWSSQKSKEKKFMDEFEHSNSIDSVWFVQWCMISLKSDASNISVVLCQKVLVLQPSKRFERMERTMNLNHRTETHPVDMYSFLLGYHCLIQKKLNDMLSSMSNSRPARVANEDLHSRDLKDKIHNKFIPLGKTTLVSIPP